MKKGKKAEMGIGTLIIFIAMILVAAVAAGVLIQTSTSLQSKALLTGERSKGQVATAVQTVSIAAEDGSTNNNVENFEHVVKIAPGSDAVRLSDAVITFETDSESQTYTYNSTATCGTQQTGQYAASALLGEDNGYLEKGDVVMLCYDSPSSVGEDETVRISLTPKVGNRMVIETSLPEVITETRTQIYPSN